MQWKPDSLFYQAHVCQVRGDSHAVAYRRKCSPARSACRVEKATPGSRSTLRRVGNPAWVQLQRALLRAPVGSCPLSRRSISPVYGTDSLRVVSLVAYVLMGPGCALRSFACEQRPLVSFLVAAGALFLAPVRFGAGLPLMDVSGVTLETLAALGALLALERTALARLWGARARRAVAHARLDRDSRPRRRLARCARQRTRAAYCLSLVAVGRPRPLPSPLLLGAPLREAMAYTFVNFYRPRDSSWHWVAGTTGTPFHSMAEHNLTYLWEHPYSGLYFVGGYLALFIIRTPRRPVRPLLPGRGRCVDPARRAPAELHGVPPRADVRADRGRGPRPRPRRGRPRTP